MFVNKYRVFGAVNDWARPGCEGKYGGIGWYRIINPLEKIGAYVKRGEFRIGTMQSALSLKKEADIWVRIFSIVNNMNRSGVSIVDMNPFVFE